MKGILRISFLVEGVDSSLQRVINNELRILVEDHLMANAVGDVKKEKKDILDRALSSNKFSANNLLSQIRTFVFAGASFSKSGWLNMLIKAF